MTARVLVNGKPVQLTLTRTGDTWGFETGGRLGQALIKRPERGVYHVLFEGRSYEIRIAGDTVDIDGRELDVVLDDPRDAPARVLDGSVQGRQPIAAPMPGKVIRVLVAEGDEVECDQGIVVIEAMKMQNELKSPKAGIVKTLPAKEGTTVVAGDILAIVE